MERPLSRENEPPVNDLRQTLAVLRRRFLGIALVTALTVASALAFSFRQTPVYASTAKVQVKPPTANQFLQNVPVSSIVSLDTERALVLSTAVATIAAENLGGGRDPQDLLGNLSVEVPVNTQILEITFSDPDPAAAQEGAQAFATAYLDFKTREALEAFTSVRTGVQKQIQGLQDKLSEARDRFAKAPAGSPEQQEAQSDIDLATSQIAIYRNQMGTLSVVDVDPGAIIEPAPLPLSPASPDHLRTGLLALMMGIVLGVGIAFLREHLDDRLSGREDLETQIGAPVLAVVPKVPNWKKRDRVRLASLDAPKSATAEAYRTVRTNFQFIARSEDFKILTVTSPVMGEGKTTTTANLAATLALGGKRVIAVSCDLRKPRLHRFFDVPNKVGLTSILTGQATLPEAAQRCGLDTLRILASGPTPPNPTELLESPEMEQLLDELRRSADFVLLDTPPVLAVSDPLIVAPRTDGVLIVADAENTTRGAIAHVRDQLEQVQAKVVGGVLNNFDPSRAKYYPSYYRYYYSYRYRPEVEQPPTSGNGKELVILDPEEMWQ